MRYENRLEVFPLPKASAPGCDVQHARYAFVNITAAKNDIYHGQLVVPATSNATNATHVPACFYWGASSLRLVVQLGASTCADKAAPPSCQTNAKGKAVQVMASDFVISCECGCLCHHHFGGPWPVFRRQVVVLFEILHGSRRIRTTHTIMHTTLSTHAHNTFHALHSFPRTHTTLSTHTHTIFHARTCAHAHTHVQCIHTPQPGPILTRFGVHKLPHSPSGYVNVPGRRVVAHYGSWEDTVQEWLL